MKFIHFLTFTLLLIGGLNWGLFGITGWDVSVWLGGMTSQLARALYLAVGVSTAIVLATHSKDCKMCGKKMGGSPMM